MSAGLSRSCLWLFVAVCCCWVAFCLSFFSFCACVRLRVCVCSVVKLPLSSCVLWVLFVFQRAPSSLARISWFACLSASHCCRAGAFRASGTATFFHTSEILFSPPFLRLGAGFSVVSRAKHGFTTCASWNDCRCASLPPRSFVRFRMTPCLADSRMQYWNGSWVCSLSFSGFPHIFCDRDGGGIGGEQNRV